MMSNIMSSASYYCAVCIISRFFVTPRAHVGTASPRDKAPREWYFETSSILDINVLGIITMFLVMTTAFILVIS